jgi:hypothetical protein
VRDDGIPYQGEQTVRVEHVTVNQGGRQLAKSGRVAAEIRLGLGDGRGRERPSLARVRTRKRWASHEATRAFPD